MKHLKLFFALFAMLALGVGNAWAETVFSDDFANVGTSSSATVSNRTGWSDFTKCYGQYNSGIRMGTSSATGSITKTAMTNINGTTTLTVTFYLAKYNSDSGDMNITVSGGGTASTTKFTPVGNAGVTSTTSEANWTDTYKCTFTVENATNATTITFATSSKRLILGPVTISTANQEPTPDPEEPSTGTSGEVTFVFDTDQGLNELGIAKPNASAGTNLGSNVYTKAPINMTATDGGTATRVWNSSGATTLRVYKSTGSLTFSSEATINKIVFNTSITANASIGTLSGTTWTGEAKEVKFTFTANATIKTISVAYTVPSSGGGSTEPVLSVEPNKVDFGTKNIYFESEKKGSLEIEITGQNLTGAVAAELSGTDASVFTLSASSFTPNAGEVSEKLTVSYEVSEARDYIATLTLSSDGVEAIELPITLKVINEEPATYVKVTNAVTDGEYLIVYEDATAPVAFNGALTALDAVSNTVAVKINNNIIVGNTEIDAATFTIATIEEGFSIQSKSGYYIGNTTAKNGLSSNKTDALKNEITFSEGDLTIKATNNNTPTYLRFNKTSDQKRFRYYVSGQEAIALYKKASEQTVTIATCENGSVSASVADGAKVLSGTTITLSNTPATGYKLAAYDVYKTGEETTKVTVTDGKFIMPEFDVTISATFELAKTLTSIEITNAATQTTFWQGETFNHDGLKVTAHFEGAADEDVTDKVTVAGSTDVAGSQTVTVSYAEGTTIKTTTYTINVKAIPNTKETAYTVADAYDIIDKLTTAEGVYIKGIVSQVDEYLSNYKSITYWISDDGTTTKQLQAYSGKGLNGADFADINGISVDDQVIICGDLKKHTDGTYEFNYDNYLVDRIKTTKADPELSYTTTEYDVNLGDAFTAPTLNNPHTLPVTYSSSNEDVATVATDGAVTIKAAGTVTITASFAGNDDYIAKEASYTINITDPNLLEVTFDATQDLDANNTERGEGKIIKAPITFACTDGILGSSTYGHYRIYANAKATFSAAEGYIITKVVLTSTASNTSSNGPAHLSTEEGTYTYSDKVGTWVGEAYTVTLSASAQVRATLITVYYKQDNRVAAGLAWNPAAVNLTIGDAFTAPTFSNPNSVTGITFTSDNTALATVNNAGVISLVSGKTGSATITAIFGGTETYKPAEVTCIITVNPKTEDVVIVAQQDGKWYALKAEDLDGANKTMAALEVEYINGVVYNITDAAKAAITWERAVIGNQVTFKHGDMYLFGTAGGTDLKLSVDECEWTYNGKSYMIGNRTFLYRAQANGFKNYNAGTNAGTADYSALPVVTAAKFEDATIITRDYLTTGNYGTICYENNITNFAGVTFYAVVGREGRKVIFDEVTELEAGMPYLFRAEATELKMALGNETATSAGKHNSLQGTFIQIDPAEENILTGNYVMYNNMIKKCGKNCGLKANRAYFIGSELESLGAPAPQVPGRKRVSMDVLGEDEATGVDNITENGVVAPALQGTYDVVGRQLVEPATTGFYIVNGKKVLVVK